METSTGPHLLIDWLVARYPTAKRVTFKRMLEAGRIRIDGAVARKLKQPILRRSIVEVARGERGVAGAVNEPARSRASSASPGSSASEARRGNAAQEPSPQPSVGVSGEGEIRKHSYTHRAPRDSPPTAKPARANGHAARRAGAKRPGSLDILYEDGDVLVVNKPAGLLTSTVAREPRPTLVAAVREYLNATDPQARGGVIHRLDRGARGILVFSKNTTAFERLKQQFFEHSVERIYHAVTDGIPVPPEGRIESRLLELPDGRVVSTRLSHKGQAAITEYKVIRAGRTRALVRVKLLTGRKHQIRVHLSEHRAAVLGDPMYEQGAPISSEALAAASESPGKSVLLLVASRLCFDHPRTRKRMTFEIKLPADFQAALVEDGG